MKKEYEQIGLAVVAVLALLIVGTQIGLFSIGDSDIVLGGTAVVLIMGIFLAQLFILYWLFKRYGFWKTIFIVIILNVVLAVFGVFSGLTGTT